MDEVNANNVETAIDWDRALDDLKRVCKQTVQMFKLPAGSLDVAWRDIATPEEATMEEVEENAE